VSTGTRSLIATLHRALTALDAGLVLLFDDLGDGLHPRLTAELVRLFTSPLSNPNGAQLVFTSHDATLLSDGSTGGVLTSDQVWLTEKTSSGATELYPLSAAQPQPEEDLGRSYRSGAFGAVPQLTEGQMARRLLRCQTLGS